MFNELDAPKEVKAESNESESGFRLINIKTEMTIVEGYDFIKEKLAELKKDIHYVGYDDRLNQTPTEESYLGKWEDERGESMFVPDDSTGQGKRAKEKLAEYGLEGIEYNDAEPDFSKCSEATVEIDSMTEDRPNNFAQADKKCAEQWNKEGKDGRTDWTSVEVREYRRESKLSWHERCDMKTMDLVHQDIHTFFSHSGGVAECKARDNAKGGDFDE